MLSLLFSWSIIMYMKCDYCSNEIETNMKFCPYCGEMIKKICSDCGAISKPEYLFCSQCGKKFAEEKSTSTIKNKSPILSHSFDHEEDLRKHATVLFADVRGSTAIVEGLDPEEAKNILLPIVDAMCEAVYR